MEKSTTDVYSKVKNWSENYFDDDFYNNKFIKLNIKAKYNIFISCFRNKPDISIHSFILAFIKYFNNLGYLVSITDDPDIYKLDKVCRKKNPITFLKIEKDTDGKISIDSDNFTNIELLGLLKHFTNVIELELLNSVNPIKKN